LSRQRWHSRVRTMSPSADRRVMSLVEAGMALASELDLDGLLQRAADISREVIGARYGAVGVLGDQGELVRFVYSGIDKGLADTIGDLPIGRGVLGALIEEGTPLRLQDISDHPWSYGFPENHPPMHSFLGVPIVVRDHIFGRLYLTEKQGPEDFTKDDERIALSFAAQAGVAIDNARLIEELKARGESLAILEERDRISRDLHDGVIQSIYSVGLSIQGAMTLIERDPDGTRSRMDEVIVTLDNVVRDVRSYIFALQPKSVEALGLKRGIEELVEDLEINALVETSVQLSETALDRIPDAATGDIIQIVRGVLSNIARHARATQVSVECAAKEDDTIIMSIEDDGIGFDPATVHRGDGLTNIEDRSKHIGGQFIISNRAPRGTVHTLSFPGVKN
jgi:signal transduction histidine kinase